MSVRRISTHKQLQTAPCTPPRQEATLAAPATPATPLAGLKLLSRLASPHLRDLEQERRALALHECMREHHHAEVSEEISEEEEEESEEEQVPTGSKRKATPPSSSCKGRKDKSLGLISEKFLTLYEDDGEQEISLDVAAQCLGVERRRIYDIVNVLEGLEVVVRKGKNTYTWFGLERLPTTLAKLKALVPTHLDSPLKQTGLVRARLHDHQFGHGHVAFFV